MKKWKESWNQLLPYEQVFRAISLFLSVVVLTFWVLYLLQILDVIDAKLPLLTFGFIVMGVEGFTSAVYNWRQSRSVAIVNICCSVFVWLCSILSIVLMR